jgi:hypothetical protein
MLFYYIALKLSVYAWKYFKQIFSNRNFILFTFDHFQAPQLFHSESKSSLFTPHCSAVPGVLQFTIYVGCVGCERIKLMLLNLCVGNPISMKYSLYNETERMMREWMSSSLDGHDY